MGWSTWCTNDLCGLRDKCSEFEVRKRADALVDQGLSEFGYKWLLLDDCWADHDRDADGNLQPNPHQFPSGMKALADYIHNKGVSIPVLVQRPAKRIVLVRMDIINKIQIHLLHGVWIWSRLTIAIILILVKLPNNFSRSYHKL